MGWVNIKKSIVSINVFLFSLLSIFMLVNAENKSSVVHGEKYQIHVGNEFIQSKGRKVEKYTYGRSSLGNLSITDAKAASNEYDGFATYGATSEVTLSYSYDGKYHSNEKENWNIVSSDEKAVNGYDLSKKIEQGAVIVQKSNDGKAWENASVLCNCFKKNSKGLSEFYTISKEDVLEGKFFRVIVVYQMRRKTGTEPGFILPKDTYMYKKFMEVYDFYICYGKNPVVFTDIETGEKLDSKSTVKKGFIINKGGTDYSVSIKKDDEKAISAKDLSSITEPGNYDITIKSDTGEKYQKKIAVTEGVKLTEAKPILYEGGKKGKYQITEPVKGKSIFGTDSLTTLKIGQNVNTSTVTAKKNGYEGYGVYGNSASIYLNVNAKKVVNSGDWEIYADSYGKKENETIGKSDNYDGVLVGQIDTGALIVLKSSDGKKWEKAEEVCAKTSDFYKYYGEKGDIHIYDPDGSEILNGVYLRILYAYEMYQKSTKTYDRCLEVYNLYLCSGDLNAVTFKNLTVKDDIIKNQIGEEQTYQLEVYKSAQSLKSGSCTVTGFEINTKGNPTVSYSVKHNDNNIAIPSDHKFTASGRYDITLKGALGNSTTVTLFVDRLSSEQAFEKYFSKRFIEGVRIFSEGELPVFEGGNTKYYVSDIDEDFIPVSGTIKNVTTNTERKIAGNRRNKEGIIRDPGEYVATFSTAQNSQDGKLPGDYRVFTYRFMVIEEGTAPGPVINKTLLNEYSCKSMSDAYPMYYGLTYPSATKGDITLAFSDKKAAKDYAYKYEKGLVEPQDNGTYRYKGKMQFSQKDEYVSAKDLTDAIYKIAERAVNISFFDLTEDFTYATLREEDIEKKRNELRTYKLDRSVTVFAEGEREKLCDLEALTIISDKPCYYIIPDKDGSTIKTYTEFKLKKDEQGYDSNKAYITDKNGKKYDLAYDESVGKQLNKAGCPSGIVKITEETCYGQACDPYEAVFIADNDNTGKLGLTCYMDGKESTESFIQGDNGATIEVEAFKISTVSDELDPYSIVKVIDPNNEKTYYVADQEFKKTWSDQGEYTVSLINRLGFSFSINVVVKNSEYATLSFIGDGAENVESIMVRKNDKNVELPQLSRMGYVLIGFEDEQGNRYTDSINKITFSGSEVLTPIWEANKYKLVYKDSKGKEIKTVDVEYGSKYEVESFDWDKNEEFKGWLKDGELLDGSVITVDKEADIVLVPVIEDSEADENNAQNDNTNSDNTSKPTVAVIILCAIGAVLLASAIRKRKYIKEILKSALRKSDLKKGDKDDEA